MPKDNKKNISPFAIDVLKLVTGTTIAQAIGILASPILTRLYGPEAFGLFAIFTSITSIIGVIACMRYELAIMLPERDEDAINILGLCMLMVVVITVFTTVIIFFGGGLITNLLQASGLKTYLWLVPPFVFMSGIFLALNYWNSRTRQFGRLSVARITNSFGTTTVQLGAGLSGFTSGGSLIGAGLVGMLVSTGVLGLQIWRDDDVKFKKSVKWRGIIKVMKRYKKFPLIDSISALLNTISWQLPVILLSAFFSPVIVGFYALGMRVLQTPMSFIGGAIAQVFFQRGVKAYHQLNLSIIVADIFEILLKISVFPMLILLISGWDLFIVIFGYSWGEAGKYAQLLSIWAIFWFISSPLSTILSITEKLKTGFFLTVLNISTRFISLLVGGVLGDVFLAIALFSFSGLFVYGFACFVFLKYAGLEIKNSFCIMGNVFFDSTLFLIPLIIIKILIGNSVIITISALIITIIYSVFIFKTDSKFRNLIHELQKIFKNPLVKSF